MEGAEIRTGGNLGARIQLGAHYVPCSELPLEGNRTASRFTDCSSLMH